MAEVVGAAIICDGRVLACRRTQPEAVAGRWEFPGGKVEPTEDADRALRREITEELGCDVEVLRWLRGAVAIRPGLTLRVAVARLRDGRPVPAAHDQLRWLRADQLGEVDWLEPDRPFLKQVRQALLDGRTAPTPDDQPAARVC